MTSTNGKHIDCHHAGDWAVLAEWKTELGTKLDTLCTLVTATNGRIRKLEECWAFARGVMTVVILLELLPKLLETWKN